MLEREMFRGLREGEGRGGRGRSRSRSRRG